MARHSVDISRNGGTNELNHLGAPLNPINKLFPMITSNDLSGTKAFYTDTLGYSLKMDVDGYLQVLCGDGPELSFLSATASFPGTGTGPHSTAFSGNGLVFSIPVKNADTYAKELENKGVKLLSDTQDKPWGWRSFMVADPNGIVLDFFHVLPDDATKEMPQS